ncbi:MAG: hypothetical protein AB1757_06910 [Acidobacteriota bacterium]
MFCPKCGTTQDDTLNFCKQCGADLAAVRQAVTKRVPNEKFDMSKTWVAEILMSDEERERRELEHQARLSPADKRYKQTVKRYNEIKAGVITSSVGISVMIFLYIFMRGITLSGEVGQGEAEILNRIWVAGLIPFFIGLGLIFNGLIVSKKLVELHNFELQQKDTGRMLESKETLTNDALTPTADWYESSSPRPSVTEHTTRQLDKSTQ